MCHIFHFPFSSNTIPECQKLKFDQEATFTLDELKEALDAKVMKKLLIQHGASEEDLAYLRFPVISASKHDGQHDNQRQHPHGHPAPPHGDCYGGGERRQDCLQGVKSSAAIIFKLTQSITEFTGLSLSTTTLVGSFI